MKASIILSHSSSPFFTYLYEENELLWGPVHLFGIFLGEKLPHFQGLICNETFLQNYP